MEPEVFTREFDQKVCDQFYAIGQEAKRRGDPEPPVGATEQSVQMLAELVKSEGLTPNMDTIRKYSECALAGYRDGSSDGSSEDSGGSGTLLLVGAIAVGALGVWLATRK